MIGRALHMDPLDHLRSSSTHRAIRVAAVSWAIRAEQRAGG